MILTTHATSESPASNAPPSRHAPEPVDLTPEIHTRLLAAFVVPGRSLPDIAAEFEISLLDLVHWFHAPDTRQQIAAVHTLFAAREQVLLAHARHDAILYLQQQVLDRDDNTEPVRKAASALLKSKPLPHLEHAERSPSTAHRAPHRTATTVQPPIAPPHHAPHSNSASGDTSSFACMSVNLSTRSPFAPLVTTSPFESTATACTSAAHLDADAVPGFPSPPLEMQPDANIMQIHTSSSFVKGTHHGTYSFSPFRPHDGPDPG